MHGRFIKKSVAVKLLKTKHTAADYGTKSKRRNFS